MSSDLAMKIALKAWQTERTDDADYNVYLAKAFADILDKYIIALQWMSGAADFDKDGKARASYEKIVLPLLDESTLDMWDWS